MTFSSGDWIATLVGGSALCRWLWDGIKVQMAKDAGQDNLTARETLRVESELKVHEARDEVQFKNVFSSLARIERRLDEAVRQLSFLAMGVNNRAIEIPREDRKD